MNAKLAAVPQHARATIMDELAAVLRDADASTTNIESAIARSSISSQDIAAKFGSKRELLLAMVAELSDSMSAPLEIGSNKPDLKQRLVEFGQRVTDSYANSHLRALYRIAITEAIRHTGLGHDFYEVGPGRLTQRLADFLRHAQTEGALRRGDPQMLASHFLSLLRANVDVTDTLAYELATSRVARDAYVRKVVDLFCAGIDRGTSPC